ncbi:hypothetical protein BXZ70DRAFT_118747 [Cristinia sonorae]|uniref:Uncharacterized protein n=1 Tax=Cristinia sonorae TaxID=1940300 RepID=A0A8K0URU5_9AGAR|nr:hypothetical protein BXZ70DRAFT_118747 [Cristinia sonorae]
MSSDFSICSEVVQVQVERIVEPGMPLSRLGVFSARVQPSLISPSGAQNPSLICSFSNAKYSKHRRIEFVTRLTEYPPRLMAPNRSKVRLHRDDRSEYADRALPSTKAPPPSQDSDDNGMMELVAKQMQSSWDKKKKEQEEKFLATAKTELLKCAKSRVEEVVDATKQMDSIYEQFLMDYAGICDEIRHILTTMREEQIKMTKLIQSKHTSMRDSEKEREMGQVRGLATAKKAIADTHDLIETLHSSV